MENGTPTLYYDSLPSYNTTLTEQIIRDFMVEMEQSNMQGARSYTLITGSAGYELYTQAMRNTGITVTSATAFNNLQYTYNAIPSIGAYITEDKLYFNGKIYAESKDPGRLLDLKKRLERIHNG